LVNRFFLGLAISGYLAVLSGVFGIRAGLFRVEGIRQRLP
jgi:hypothetical protein